MVRIAWRDLGDLATLEETVTTLSRLADACLDTALAKLGEWAVARDGVPRENTTGEPASHCGRAVKIIACIEDPVVVQKILGHLNAKASAADRTRPESRAPPQAVLFS